MRRTVVIGVAGTALCLCAISVMAAQNDYSGTYLRMTKYCDRSPL